MAKLTPEHVFLTSRSCMNVSLATQVKYFHLYFAVFTDYCSYYYCFILLYSLSNQAGEKAMDSICLGHLGKQEP